ncbi:hypothetical protein BsWGS_13626 [Bradybaena similaris]
MKKLWKRVTKRSPSRSGEASPKSGSTRGSVASLNIGYQVREKDLGKLHKAAWRGDLNKVKQLAKKDPSPLDKENRTPLHLACVQGHEHIVQELLEWKAKANIGDNQAKTPLMRAIEFQQEGCVTLLLAYKVDIDTVDAHGNTALHMAAEGGNLSIVTMLIRSGASLNTRNKEGLAPLHLAVKNKHADICQLLLQEKADVNVEDTHFRTPLMYACQDGSISLVKLLLQYNADTTHKDSKGWTADDCSVIQGHHACSQLISEHNHRMSLASPRSISQPSSLLNTPRDKDSIGLPVFDGGDENSDNETESKVSGTPGSDSWADSPDVSLADDSGRLRKEVSVDEEVEVKEEEGKIAAPKINLAKFAKNIRISESDTEGESMQGTTPRGQSNTKTGSFGAGAEPASKTVDTEKSGIKLSKQGSLQSQTSGEDNSWGDSPVTPRKILPPRVSFKKAEEISDIIESDGDSDSLEPDDDAQKKVAPLSVSKSVPKTSAAAGADGYVPSVSTNKAQFASTAEERKAFMEEFGISDVDDISELSDSTPPAATSLPRKMSHTDQVQEDSEWDSSAVSGLTPRPGILKTGTHDNKNNAEYTSPGIYQQQLQQQQQQQPPATFADLDNKNNVEFSKPNNQQRPHQQTVPVGLAADEDSEWDSSVVSGYMSTPRSGMRARTLVGAGQEVHVWGNTGGDGVQPLAAVVTGQRKESVSEWDSDLEEMVNPISQQVITTTAPPPPVPVFAEQTHDDDEWDSTVKTATPMATMGMHHTEMNVVKATEVTKSGREMRRQEHIVDDIVPPPATAEVIEGGMQAVDEGDEEESISEWDSEADEPPSNAEPAGTHAFTASMSPGFAGKPQLAPTAVDGHLESHENKHSDLDSDDETETISSWEKERKLSKSNQMTLSTFGHQKVIEGKASRKQEEGFKNQLSSEQEDINNLSVKGKAEHERKEEEKIQEIERQAEINMRLQREAAERQAEISRLQREEIDRRAEVNRLQSEEMERQEEINRLQREEIERHAEINMLDEVLQNEEMERQWEEDIENHEDIDREWEMEQAEMNKRLRNERENVERHEEINRLQGEERQAEINRLQREELERQVEMDMIFQKEVLQHEEMESQWNEDIENHEDIEREWEMEEAKIKERLNNEMDDFIQDPDSPTDTVDSVLFQQQELARIDEQFQKERAEREKREEEVNRLRKQEEEARRRREEQEKTKADYQESPPVMLKSTPPAVFPRPQPSTSGVYANIGSSAVQELKQRLQVIPTTPVSTLAPLYSELDDDDSLQSDIPGEERPSLPKYFNTAHGFYRPHDPLDDDALSYTSTEFEDPVLSTPAYGRERDILANINISDASSLLKVQEYVRETCSGLEHERNQRVVLENKLRLSNKEKDDIVQKLQSLSQQKSTLEQTKLELEAKIRTLEYNVTEESEKRKNTESLLTKTKEQLARKESQFSSELEAKQKAELALRNIQIEMRTMANTVKELEEEKKELERQLTHANSLRVLQEQLNDDHQKLLLKQQQVSKDEDFLDSAMEFHGDSNKLQAELYALKMDMDRQRSRFKDEISLMGAENEELMSKVEELRNDLKLNEEALAHATMQYNFQLSSLRTDISTANSVTERERAAKEKLEAEIEILKARLTSSNQEMDKAVMSRNESERELQREKENFSREMDRKNGEISALKENVQLLNLRLTNADSKLSSLENELHASNASLLERTSNLQHLQQELERLKASSSSLEQNYRFEKEANVKSQVKVDSLQEKLSQHQHENLSLRQQIEGLRLNSGSQPDANEKLNNILTNLRADSDRAKASLEERNSHLLEQAAQLKEELRGSESRRIVVEQNLLRLQDERNDMVKQLSQAEASLQIALKTREQLEQERTHLKLELEKLQQRYQITHDKSVEAQARLSELVDRLEKAENNSVYSRQQWVDTSANMQGLVRSKLEQDESLQQLQIDNARFEAELRFEKQRADMLYQDLQDSQKVRSSLEALCANLKSTSAHLEERLGTETAARVVYEAEARDHKTLYDLETKSRSKLGLRIADLEQSKQSSESRLLEEKNRASLANEERRSLETRLEAEMTKNQQLQKDVTTLKMHLKSTKNKVKEGQPATQATFAASNGDLRSELESKYRQELNRKLEEVNRFLDSQSQLRDRLDSSRTEVEVRLMSDKRRLEEEIHNLRVKFEQAVSQRETMEMEAKRFRELYESEMKWRIRVSDQLQLATERSSNLKSKLNNERVHRNHLTDSIGNFNSSIISSNNFDLGRVNGFHDDELSNKIKAELDRSIAKHLEAAPHDQRPVLRQVKEPIRLTSSLTQSTHDYIDILKRKYHV